MGVPGNPGDSKELELLLQGFRVQGLGLRALDLRMNPWAPSVGP